MEKFPAAGCDYEWKTVSLNRSIPQLGSSDLRIVRRPKKNEALRTRNGRSALVVLLRSAPVGATSSNLKEIIEIFIEVCLENFPWL